MRSMKFRRLSLLSHQERRAFDLRFTSDRTILTAGNGFGKSAILKSLYDTLGARPHKIDRLWRRANVLAVLEFSIDGEILIATKEQGRITVYDQNRRAMASEASVGDVAPAIAKLFNFEMTLTDRKGNTRQPPPSFVFAPFYIDQDRSWYKTWDSFSDLRMFPGHQKALAEYHSGLRPNAYYRAKGERDRLRAEVAALVSERSAVDRALKRIEDTFPSVPYSLTLTEFTEEADRLVRDIRRLSAAQERYTQELTTLVEEREAWANHLKLLQKTIAEIDIEFGQLLGHSPDVECPMCGQHYSNDMVGRFEIKADEADLIEALSYARERHNETRERLRLHQQKLADVERQLAAVEVTFSLKRGAIELRDVVVAEGRHQATMVMRERLATLDDAVGDLAVRIADLDKAMRETESRQRRRAIYGEFERALGEAAIALDVPLPVIEPAILYGFEIGRGSETPRALSAYYYAFLSVASMFASSTYCPIVIDAPNQQGQDKYHLKQIIAFWMSRTPAHRQVIMGVEEAETDVDAQIVDIAWRKDQVLREELYDQVREEMKVIIRQTLL